MRPEFYSPHEDKENQYIEAWHEERFKNLLHGIIADQINTVGKSGIMLAGNMIETCRLLVNNGMNLDDAILEFNSQWEASKPHDILNDPTYQVYFEVAIKYIKGYYDD